MNTYKVAFKRTKTDNIQFEKIKAENLDHLAMIFRYRYSVWNYPDAIMLKVQKLQEV